MWELDCEECWVLKNWCFWTVVLEKTLESPLEGPVIRRFNQSILKEISPEVFFGRTDVQAETPILWPPDTKSWLIGNNPDAGKRLKPGGEGDDRGWDGWMASPTQWTWVWVNSGNWWWTGRPGVLQSMVSQRVRHKWATELNWAEECMSLGENIKGEVVPNGEGCCRLRRGLERIKQALVSVCIPEKSFNPLTHLCLSF